MRKDSWIVVNIGCIECGVSSAIVGVFSSEDYARETAGRLNDSHEWREGGQNFFEVFLTPEIDKIKDGYQ